jgi:putative glycosyltransferase (TIGR04372 family)
MKHLPKRERLIDYAHLGIKSAWMDVFLAASCRLWIGTNSGLFMLASTFGVPVALTNVAPTTFRPWSYKDVFIPKLYYSEAERRLLTFRESLAPELYTSYHIDVERVTPIDNDPEDIVALVREMLERLEGRRTYDSRDQALQDRFNGLRPDYYPFGVTSRIGADFLKRYSDLLR